MKKPIAIAASAVAIAGLAGAAGFAGASAAMQSASGVAVQTPEPTVIAEEPTVVAEEPTYPEDNMGDPVFGGYGYPAAGWNVTVADVEALYPEWDFTTYPEWDVTGSRSIELVVNAWNDAEPEEKGQWCSAIEADIMHYGHTDAGVLQYESSLMSLSSDAANEWSMARWGVCAAAGLGDGWGQDSIFVFPIYDPGYKYGDHSNYFG